MSNGSGALRVAMVGHAFMGAAHSQAWRTAPRVFDLDRDVELRLVCGRDAAGTEAAARRQGWAEWCTDWRQAVERDDVDVVDVCTPGDTHLEIAVAALAAGKHVLCEKPLANSVAEAEQMVAAADAAGASGVRSAVGFNYRRVPALAYARRLVGEGRLGDIRHVRAQYLSDWLVDPQVPLLWRLRRETAGSGALGDIGAHVVDLTQYVTGHRFAAVSAMLRTFVPERPLPDGTGRGAVTVDDAAAFVARTDGGAMVVLEATRMAGGRKNAMRLEVNGSRGSLAFDFEAMNELYLYDATEPAVEGGFRRVLVTEPEHPYLEAWWPPGHGLAYDATFIHQAADFVRDVAAGRHPSPSFADGLGVQRVLAAAEESAATGRWTDVSTH